MPINAAHLFKTLGVAMAYFIAARLSLELAFGTTNASPVWPPSGLALSALLLIGRSAAPGIFLGACLANLVVFGQNHGQVSALHVAASLLMGLGNLSEGLVGMFLVKNWIGGRPFSTTLGGIQFILAAGVAAAASALLGAGTLGLTGIAPWELFSRILLTWWLGDVAGILVIVPLVLTGKEYLRRRTGGFWEQVALQCLLLGVAGAVFWTHWRAGGFQLMAYAITPILIFIAFRLGSFPAYSGVLAVSALAIYGTAQDAGPLSGGEVQDDLLILQAFVAVISAKVIFMASSLAERSQSHAELARMNATLEERVASRTQSLLQTERQYRDLFENSSDTLLLVDPATSRFIAANSNAVRQLGYSREELIGMPSKNLEGSTDPAVLEEKVRTFREQGRLQGEHQHRKKDGSVIPVEVTATLIEMDGRKVIQVVSRDISEIKNRQLELMRSEARFRQLSDASMEGLVIHDQGRIVLANRAIAELTGYSQEGLLGMVPSDLAAPESLATVEENIRKGSEAPYSVAVIRKDGTRFDAELCGRPIEYLGKPMRVTSIRDVSERRRAEELQRQSLEALESANRAKSQFLATMSHEIRTPLNGIMGMTSALQDTPLDATQKRYVRMLRSCGSALLAQVNDILDIAKIESGSMALESVEFELDDLLEETLAPFREEARQRGLRLETDLEPSLARRVRGDPNRLRQVLANVVGNAVKFTAAGSVSLSGRIDSSANGPALRMEIGDTGIGMTPDTLSKLFRPFTQADASMSRKFGGSGLGLTICKQLIELMGGSIRVESAFGQGSRFSIECPLEPLQRVSQPDTGPGTVPKPGEPADSAAGLRILVVEDDEVNREVARIFLNRHGCRTEFAATGDEALDLIRANEYALVLMDCQLPGMDGFETTRRIRRMQRGERRVRIVAMTANAVQGDRERCLSAGMDDYLPKPLDPERLSRALQQGNGGDGHGT